MARWRSFAGASWQLARDCVGLLTKNSRSDARIGENHSRWKSERRRIEKDGQAGSLPHDFSSGTLLSMAAIYDFLELRRIADRVEVGVVSLVERMKVGDPPVAG
jgi:hypothetical protein